MNARRYHLLYLRMLPLFAASCMLLYCASPLVFAPVGDSCAISSVNAMSHPDWRELRARADAQGVFGCLQVAWGVQRPDVGTVTQAVQMRGKQLFSKSPSGIWDGAVGFDLPQAADGQKLRFRVFFFRTNVAEETVAGLCAEQLKAPSFDCYDAAQGACQVFMEFRPQSDRYETFAIPEVVAGESQCHIFLRRGQETTKEPLVEPSLENTSDTTPERTMEPASEPQVDGVEPALPDDGSTAPDDGPDAPDLEVGPELLPEGRCRPSDTRPCYPFATGSRGQGLCVDGVQTCDSGGTWGRCEGAVGPVVEVCDSKDNDCDGQVDNGCPFLAAGGSQGKDQGNAFAMAPNGDVVVTGHIAGASLFGQHSSMQTSGSYDSFVAKIGKDGVWKGVKVVDTSGAGRNDNGQAITVDGSGRTWLAGQFEGAISFGSNALTATTSAVSGGTKDGYITSLSPQLTWEHAIQISSTGTVLLTDIAAEPGGKRVIVMGVVMPNVQESPVDQSFTIGGKKLTLAAGSRFGVFLAALSYMGTGISVDWAEVVSEWKSTNNGLAAQPKFKWSSGGTLTMFLQVPKETIRIGTKSVVNTVATSFIVTRLLVQQSGVSVVWTKQTAMSSSNEVATDLFVHPGNAGAPDQIVITGQVKGTFRLTPTISDAAVAYDVFVASLEASDPPRWKWLALSKCNGNDVGVSVAANSQGEVFVGGHASADPKINWMGVVPVGELNCATNDWCPFFAKLDPQGKWRWVIGGARGSRNSLGSINGIMVDRTDVLLMGTVKSTTFANKPISRAPSNDGGIFVGKNVHLLLGLP